MISFHGVRPQGRFDPKIYAKNWRTLKTASVSLITEVVEYGCWSPCLWDSGERREKNFKGAAWCVLDFDDPELTLQQALNVFCDMTHIIGLTKSHQKDKGGVICDRFRVCLLFEQPITSVWDFKASMSHAVQHYESDPACIDAARFYWPCTEIVSVNSDLDAYRQEVKQGEEPATAEPSAIEDLKGKPVTMFVKRLHWFGAPAGKRNKLCFMAALEMARKEYSASDIAGYVFAKVPTAPDFTQEEKDSIVSSAMARAGDTPIGGQVYG